MIEHEPHPLTDWSGKVLVCKTVVPLKSTYFVLCSALNVSSVISVSNALSLRIMNYNLRSSFGSGDLSTGIDSPVNELSFTTTLPESTIMSHGTCVLGSTTTRSPGTMSEDRSLAVDILGRAILVYLRVIMCGSATYLVARRV